MSVSSDFDAYLEELYRCRECSASGDAAPAPPAGLVDLASPIDVLLVGWNPQLKGYRPNGTPPYQRWRDDAAAELEKEYRSPGPFSRLVGRLLPTGVTFRGRVVNTRVWKVPTLDKRASDASRAATCAEKHLLRELSLLRPRLVLTYDQDAARFFIQRAVAIGVPVINQGGWPSVLGWAEPNDTWGWPMSLLAVTGKRDKTHPEVAFINRRGAELLEATKRFKQPVIK